MNKDLTVGKPSSVLWRFCIPLFGSIIFQQLYNIADSFVAGKFVGEDALAAVGNGYEITLIFIAFAFGCNIGCSVTVSQMFGAKHYRELKTAVYTTLIASGVLCTVLMAAGLLLDGQLLRLINTPDDIFPMSKLYLDIYILGLPFVFYYNVATGIFSALGDSKTPFIFLMCSSTANIGVDILFTAGMKNVFTRGVDGVAWATFLCQGVSCLLALVFVTRRLRTIKSNGKAPLFSWTMLGKISAVAVPSIMQQSFISVGNIVLQSVINGFGKGVMAGYSASIKLNNLVVTSLSTLGNGITSFTAQNIGAGKRSRVREGFSAGLRLVLALSIPISILYVVLSRYLLLIFLDDPSADALRSGMEFLCIVAPFYCVVATKLTADGVLRGAGMMKQFVVTTFTDLLLRTGLAFIMSKTSLGSTGIWLSWPIGWGVSTVMSVMFYLRGGWKPQSQAETAATDETGQQ